MVYNKICCSSNCEKEFTCNLECNLTDRKYRNSCLCIDCWRDRMTVLTENLTCKELTVFMFQMSYRCNCKFLTVEENKQEQFRKIVNVLTQKD